MNSIVIALWLVSSSVIGMPSSDGGIKDDGIKVAKPQLSGTSLKILERQLTRNFNQTYLRTRIVKVKIKRVHHKTNVYLTWHPRESTDIPNDTFTIVRIVNRLVPTFYSLSLKAVHPEYMRWSGHIMWNTTIIKKATEPNGVGDSQPQPLYQ